MGERCTYVYRYVCIYGKLVRHNKNEVRLHDRYVRRRDARVKERVNDEIPLFFFFSFLPLSPLLRYFVYHYFRPFNPLPLFSSKDKNRYFFGCFFFLYIKITYLFFLLSFKNRFTSYSTSSAKRLPCRLIYQNDDGVASTTAQ